MNNLLSKFLIAVLCGILFFQPIFAVRFDNNSFGKPDEKIKPAKPEDKKAAPKRKDKESSSKSKNSDKPGRSKISMKNKYQKPAAPAELEGQSATRLPNGQWLLLGGNKDGEISNRAFFKDDEKKSIVQTSGLMKFARAGHTATLLPNGNVLVLGGKGADGKIVPEAEVFAPQTGQFTGIKIENLIGRTKHTATLLTSGLILVAGGLGEEDKIVSRIELLDAGSFEHQTISEKMQAARFSHTAELQADGTVLFKNGYDENSIEVAFPESFDPETRTFTIAGEMPETGSNEIPRISFSSPGNGDTVGIDVHPVLRFSKLLNVKTVNSQTVRLTENNDEIPARLVPAENGRLLFVSPLEKLKANTTYYLRIGAAFDNNNIPLAETVIVFKTEEFCELPQQPTGNEPHHPANTTGNTTKSEQIIDEDTWLPGDERFKREKTPERKTPALEAPANITAISGRVLSISGKPLRGATLMLQGQSVITDNEGRFLLSGLKPIQSGMVIHGETINSPGKTYGSFEVLVDIDEGKTNVLPYTIYLPVIDKQNEVSLETPTLRDIAVNTPRLPGMEVRVAANSVLKMPAGHGMSHNLADMNTKSEMRSLGITPIPVERPPFPLPLGTRDGLLFTLQMHGAKVEGPNGEKRPGLRFTFPNYGKFPAGTRISLWNYDSTKTGWVMYGEATVSKDASKIIPDLGVELEGMQCISFITLGGAPATGPNQGSHGFDGDPVDLASGLFMYEQTDIVIPDTIPINLSRTYRQNDGAARAFGVGVTQSYNYSIVTDWDMYCELVVPGGAKYRFDKDPNNPSIYRHTDTPTGFYKAEIRKLDYPRDVDYYEGGYEVKMRDGSRFIFARMNYRGGQPVGVQYVNILPHRFIDRFGNTLTFTRDPITNQMTRITTPNGKWLEYNYDANGQVSFVRDNIGRTVSYTYDAQKRLIKVTDVLGGETEYTYDSSHRMLTLKDARGVVNLTNEYDADGRVKKQTSADGTIYQYAYTTFTETDGNRRIIQTDVTNPRGLVRRMNYNDKGFPSSETFGVGRTDAWSYTYERDSASNRVIRITDSLNQKTAFNYDEFGNVLSTTSLENTPDAVTTSTTYTNFDNVATITDSLNRTSNFTYDNKGLLTSAQDWLNRASTFTYNDKGQILTATDNAGRMSRFTYDRGTPIESEDPLGRKTKQFVDGAGRATRIFDPLGGVMKYRYNKANRPVEVTDPMGRTGSLLHDAVGNILEITDSKGGKIKYTYDSMGRPLTRTNQLNQVETYQYDAYGNLWKTTDFKGQITEFTYDVFNRPTLIKYGDNSTTSYIYDAKGRVSSTTDSAGGTISYGYDVHDRINSETTAAGTINYGYDAGDRLISMQAANQALITYGYDTADRIQTITQDGQAVSFTYDDTDRRQTMTLPNGITVYYTYDTASQLKTLVYKRGATVLGDVDFEYDANGRRTRVSGSLAQILSPGTFNNTSYDASNKQTQANSQSLTYDQNGNLLSDGTNTYTWNARDELISMSGPNLSASFTYDGEGRRILKTVNGLTTTYVYDGLQVVEEREQSGPVTTQLSGGLDEVFWRKSTVNSNSNTEFLLTDAIGSTWGLADSSGSVNTQYKYDIFGTTQASGQTSATKNPLQYTSRENDETGLYYYRNRYYSPNLRRFISRDPLGESAGENEYAYVDNNPISLTDPLGLYTGEGGGYNALNDMGNTGGVVNFLVDGDGVAADSWTLGNYCAPTSERIWAGLRMVGRIGLTIFGGAIIRGISRFGGMFLRGAGGAILRRIPCNALTSKLLGKVCFVKGTLIHTKNGLVPIEKIKSGDEVLSYNEQTKQMEYKSVIETYVRQTETIAKLNVEGEVKPIETTPEHPFFVRVWKDQNVIGGDDGEWKEAGNLQVGDEVLSVNSQWQRITSIERQSRSETVYNFAVEDNHNYFVGNLGSLVHNICHSKILAKAMNGAGLGAKPSGYAAHHMVAWNSSNADAVLSRAILDRFKIHFNNAINGAYLPDTRAAARLTEAAYHRTLHTNAYYAEVYSRLSTATTRKQAIAVLNGIRNDLLNGLFPY